MNGDPSITNSRLNEGENDLDTDAVPLSRQRCVIEGCSLSGQNELRLRMNDNLPVSAHDNGDIIKVSNSKFWKKTKDGGDLNFLKSLWEFPKKPTIQHLTSVVSVDGIREISSDSDSEEDGNRYHNILLDGNDIEPSRGKEIYSNVPGVRGDNFEVLKTKGNNLDVLGCYIGDDSENLQIRRDNLSAAVSSNCSDCDGNSVKGGNSSLVRQNSETYDSIGSGKSDSIKSELWKKNTPEIDIEKKIKGQSRFINKSGPHVPMKPPRSETKITPDINLDDFQLNMEQISSEISNELQDFDNALAHQLESEVYDHGELDEVSWVNNPIHDDSDHYSSLPEQHNMNFGKSSHELNMSRDHGHSSDGNYGSFEEMANSPWYMYPESTKEHNMGDNSETDPFRNSFSDEISYSDREENITEKFELPQRRSSSVQQSNQGSYSHGHTSQTSSGEKTPSSHYPRVAVLTGGCGKCPNCRASKVMQNMEELAVSAGFETHDVLPDGNCMFRAIVDQLRMRGDLNMTASKLRHDTVKFLRENPCSEDGTHMKMFLLSEQWEEYLTRMAKDGEWGDEIALRGISEVTKRPICIISAIGDQHNQITIQPSGDETNHSQDLYLGHMDDYHYISLRPKNWEDTWFVKARRAGEKTTQKAGDYDDDSIRVTPMDAPSQDASSLNDYFKEDVPIDSVSGTPFCHLSFVLKNVLHSKNLISPEFQSLEKQIKCMNEHSMSTTTAISTGSTVERLAVHVQDTSPIETAYAYRKKKEKPKEGPGPYILVLWPYKTVLKNSEDCNSERDIFIETNETHPGYLRLVVAPLAKVTERLKALGRETRAIKYLPNSCLDTRSVQRDLGSLQIPKEAVDHSSVSYALECTFWPDSASEWKSRERPIGWPKPEFIKQAVDEGCLIVPVSHPLSSYPDYEFQFSFSRAEKLFARKNLTKHQRLCFYRFKVLVDYHTRHTPLLDSYLLKTIFFYASEVVPREQWRLNPGSTVLFLLDRLLHCLRSKNLPHYFILENNLIDHFSDDDLQKVITHLEGVRQFPIISVVLVAEHYSLSSSWMADPVIEDIPIFANHRDLHKSFGEVFIPTSLKNAINFVRYMMYLPAIEIIMEVYSDVENTANSKSSSTSSWAVGNLFEFLHQVLIELNFTQQYWLCLMLDITQNTCTVPLLTKNLPGKTIKEILRNNEDGPLADMFVPTSVTCHQRHCELRSSDPELQFLHNLTYYTMQIPNYKLSSHYLRASVDLTKQKISDLSGAGRRSDTNGKEQGRLSETKSSGQDYDKISMMYMSLYTFLVSLYNSYFYNEETELFQEYVDDLDRVCDHVGTPHAYQNLANIWYHLGSDDMYQKTLVKKEAASNSYGYGH